MHTVLWLVMTDFLMHCITSDEVQKIVNENHEAFLTCTGCEEASFEKWEFVNLNGEDRRFDWKRVTGHTCKRSKIVKASDSGTYTCSIENVQGEVKKITVFLMVLGPRDEPILELNMSLSKAVRPGQVAMKWSIANVKPRLNRNVILQSYRIEDGQRTVDLAMHVNSTTDTNGVAVYTIDPTKDIGKNRYARLELLYSAGYEISIQRGPVHMTYEEMKVVNIESTEQLDKVVLKWSTTGKYENEKPTFSVSILKPESKLVETQQRTEGTTAEVKITKRPWNFLVEVLPMAGSYTGIKGEKEIRLAERAPDVSPTGVSAQVVAYNQVHVKFNPISNIELYGEDKGCKVEVCEKQKLQECSTVNAPPRIGDAMFEKLSASKTYQARVACSTSIGFGPPSDWIIFENAAEKKAAEPVAKDGDPIAEVNIDDGFELVVLWKIKADGKTYNLNLIKKFELLQFTKGGDAQDYARKTLATDAKPGQFKTGFSPKLRFDLNCYYFAVNATLKDNRLVYGRSEETCYGFTSLSFLACYGFALILIILTCIAVWCCKKSSKNVEETKADKTRTSSTISGSKTSTGTSTSRRSKHKRHRPKKH